VEDEQQQEFTFLVGEPIPVGEFLKQPRQRQPLQSGSPEPPDYDPVETISPEVPERKRFELAQSEEGEA
jgi:hypothetical protein